MKSVELVSMAIANRFSLRYFRVDVAFVTASRPRGEESAEDWGLLRFDAARWLYPFSLGTICFGIGS